MSQTSYGLAMAVGYPGMLADAGENDVLSGAATGNIPFGCAVIKGTADDQVSPIAVTGDIAKIKGVALETKAIVNKPSLTYPSYSQYEAVNVLHKGRCWVLVEEAVVPGDAVFVRYAAGGGYQGPGGFGKTAGTSERTQLSDGTNGSKAKYLTTAAAGGLAVLEVNF